MSSTLPSFQKKVWEFYRNNKRNFPWRKTCNPYEILVSEVMLQQTQASRVIEKYASFLKAFPTVSRLAASPQSEVLKQWQGLGYNRRALSLHSSAKLICEKHKGHIPRLKEDLLHLPGIGEYTAGAVIAFAFNEPAVFIETNIRRVFIYEFFREKESVTDKELYPLIEASLDTKNPKEFYYALMDYGAHLGNTTINPNRKSKHYKKQAKFEGSIRQVRGKILKLLLQKPLSGKALEEQFENKELLAKALDKLASEGFIAEKNAKLFIK